jgi:hypothetical protein
MALPQKNKSSFVVLFLGVRLINARIKDFISIYFKMLVVKTFSGVCGFALKHFQVSILYF